LAGAPTDIVNGDDSIASASVPRHSRHCCTKHLPDGEALAPSNGKTGNVHALRRTLLACILARRAAASCSSTPGHRSSDLLESIPTGNELPLAATSIGGAVTWRGISSGARWHRR
jgi:hypothetical protein